MENNKIIKYQGGLVKQVGNALNITSKLLLINLRQLTILHLDDHILYSKAVTNCIIKRFPNAITKYVQNGDKALKYVLNCLENNKSLDLIITDCVHPGLNGIDFANAVRIKEIEYLRKIPILFITLQNNEPLVRMIKEISLVKFFLKTSPCEEINNAISNLI